MADTKHKLKKYKQYLESNPDGDKVLSVLNKLDALPVSISLLQDTGIGKLVNGFRKKPDGIGTIAKAIVNKWKNLVAEEAKKATKLDSDDEQEYVPEPPKNTKYEASYKPTSKSQSDDEYCPQHVAEEYTPEDVKHKPAHRAINKYAKYSNEKYSPQHTSSQSTSKQKYVPTKLPSVENSEDETYSPSRINDDPLPYSPQQLSDDSEEEAYDQATPEQNDSEADEYDPTNSEASPTGASASYTPTPKYESEQRHKSSSAKHSSKSAKSSHGSSKSETHSSSKSDKHSSNNKSEKYSSKHKSLDDKHSKSEKHSSKHSDSNKHSKSQNGSQSSKSKDNVPNGKHPSSSSSRSSMDKKSSSSSVKASDSSKSGDRSSSSKSSEKHSSHSAQKSKNVISESPSKSKLDKNRNEKRKISKMEPVDDSFDLFSPDDNAVVKRVKVESKPKVDTSSKSSKDSQKHSKHQSSSSSFSKPKDERHDKRESASKATKHSEKRLEKHDKHSKSSSSSKGEKRKVKVEESLNDDVTDGFSFDDFLNCDVKVPKKKSRKDPGSSGSPWSSSLGVSKPSTSKMATRVTNDSGFTVPKPSKQRLDIDESDILSLLPETSATYRPLPTRSLEDEKKHELATFDPMVIGTKQGKRTQVYSGRKHGLTEMKSLFSQCIQVLMDNIDAIDYVGGVPYDILKPVLERCSVHQLLRLEDLNPHFVGEDEELWAVHCEKEFKNQEPDEMESWREFYLRSVEDREARLEKLRMNMNKLQAAKPKSRQVQLAYVDNYVKPPREVLRKQQRYGTGKVVSASNSIQSTSKGVRASFNHHISVPQPKAVKPVAPMMQKINKMLAKRRR